MANVVTNKDLYDNLNSFRREMRETYITKDEFEPVKKAVYGACALILVGFIVALLAWVYPNYQRGAKPSSGDQTASTSQPASPSASPSAPPSATASATSHSDAANPADAQTSNSGDLLNILPKVIN